MWSLLLLVEFVPLCDLSSGGGNDLVPMVESSARALGASQVQSPNHLEKNPTTHVGLSNTRTRFYAVLKSLLSGSGSGSTVLAEVNFLVITFEPMVRF